MLGVELVIVVFDFPASVTVVPVTRTIGCPSKVAPTTSSGTTALTSTVVVSVEDEVTFTLPTGMSTPPMRGMFSPGSTGFARQ